MLEYTVKVNPTNGNQYWYLNNQLHRENSLYAYCEKYKDDNGYFNIDVISPLGVTMFSVLYGNIPTPANPEPKRINLNTKPDFSDFSESLINLDSQNDS